MRKLKMLWMEAMTEKLALVMPEARLRDLGSQGSVSVGPRGEKTASW